MLAHRFGRECQIVDASFNGDHSHIIAQFWAITAHMGNIEHNVSPVNLWAASYWPCRTGGVGNENRAANTESTPESPLCQ
jgi:hypothetical protein